MKSVHLRNGYVVILSAALIALHRPSLGLNLAHAREDDGPDSTLRKELTMRSVHRLAIDRYRMVRRIELRFGYPLSFVHGFGDEGIFPTGNADVVYWLVYLGAGRGSFVQSIRLSNGKLVAGPKSVVRYTGNSISGRPKTLLSFLKMKGFAFPRNADGRLLQELKSVRSFVGYRNDGVNDFLNVEWESGENTYEVNHDPDTRQRFRRTEDFFQKYGLPPSELEIISAATAQRAKPSTRRR